MNYSDVSVLDLNTGMTLYRKVRGRFRRDCKLGLPFTTSGPDRLQPIAFNTVDDNGRRIGTVVFAQCAT
ncbi:MAG: hypothetical protein ACREHG_00105, partial [Candidatus Saccharimonadales bacterium]